MPVASGGVGNTSLIVGTIILLISIIALIGHGRFYDRGQEGPPDKAGNISHERKAERAPGHFKTSSGTYLIDKHEQYGISPDGTKLLRYYLSASGPGGTSRVVIEPPIREIQIDGENLVNDTLAGWDVPLKWIPGEEDGRIREIEDSKNDLLIELANKDQDNAIYKQHWLATAQDMLKMSKVLRNAMTGGQAAYGDNIYSGLGGTGAGYPPVEPSGNQNQ